MNYKDYLNYIRICHSVAQFSKCFSRKIGALLVSPDKTILGTGYNGPPRGVPHCNSTQRFNWLVEQLKSTHVGSIEDYILENGWGTKCPRQILQLKSGEGLQYCPAAHAERNALINAAREGIRTKGCWLFMNCALPCQECSKEIINAGITKIICLEGPDYDIGSRWLLDSVGLEVLQIVLPE